MIFSVVFTPTSDVTKTSSRSSSTSSSTVDLPATTLVIFEKKLSLVFSKPVSSASCSWGVLSFFLKKSNNPIVYVQICKYADVQMFLYQYKVILLMSFNSLSFGKGRGEALIKKSPLVNTRRL